jgi:hypothetical protein
MIFKSKAKNGSVSESPGRSGLEDILGMGRDEFAIMFREKADPGRGKPEPRSITPEPEGAKDKEIPENSGGAVPTLQCALDSLGAQISESLERSIRYQEISKRFSVLIFKEMTNLGEIVGKFSALHRFSRGDIADIKSFLAVQDGLPSDSVGRKADDAATSLPDPGSAWLRQTKEMAENNRASSFPSPPEPANDPPPPSFKPQPESDPLAGAEFRPTVVKPNERQQDAVPRPQARPIFESEGKIAPPAAVKFEDLFAALEKYRKSEIADDNRKIGYFQNGGRMILDGESLIREMIQILENAKKLAREGVQAESPKDLFFLRQKMISSQEVLRTIIFRSFKMCDKERCVLPGYAANVLNFGVLKDLLDKLTLENWSNPEDFNRFEDYAGKLREAFYRKITPPSEYVKSILAELED